MNLPDTIYAHAQALPTALQREALDFITWLEQRHHLMPRSQAPLDTEAFLQRFAGSLGHDFPDHIDRSFSAPDARREALE